MRWNNGPAGRTSLPAGCASEARERLIDAESRVQPLAICANEGADLGADPWAAIEEAAGQYMAGRE